MNYLSICSGIEAATQAWHPLGWRPLAFAEIEPFPAAVLAHHHPHVPNLGDFTRYDEWPLQTLLNTDLLVGGTPCQAFSGAGLRQSLQDDRGNLTLTLVKLYDLITHLRHLSGRPAPLLVWENVPGVLNTPDNAFGCFLAALAGENDPLHPPGGRWKNAGYVRGPSRAIAWRILDAQYFGLAQRRRRVFLVAGPRDSFHPEQVLFEQSGLRRDTPPRRETWQNTAPTLSARTKGGGGLGTDAECDGALIADVCAPITTSPHADHESQQTKLVPELSYAIQAGAGCSKFGSGRHNQDTFIPEVGPTLRAQGFDASEDGTGRGTPLIAFPERLSSTQCASTEDLSPSLQSLNPTAIAFKPRHAVRRLTPTECERLQGFPDHHTQIPWRGKPATECPDGPRYKALGNSMAVPVMHWVGQRLQTHLTQV